MKWRKQHDQILNKMTRKQEKALAKRLRTIRCGEWSKPMSIDEFLAELRSEYGDWNNSSI